MERSKPIALPNLRPACDGPAHPHAGSATTAQTTNLKCDDQPVIMIPSGGRVAGIRCAAYLNKLTSAAPPLCVMSFLNAFVNFA